MALDQLTPVEEIPQEELGVERDRTVDAAIEAEAIAYSLRRLSIPTDDIHRLPQTKDVQELLAGLAGLAEMADNEANRAEDLAAMLRTRQEAIVRRIEREKDQIGDRSDDK